MEASEGERPEQSKDPVFYTFAEDSGSFFHWLFYATLVHPCVQHYITCRFHKLSFFFPVYPMSLIASMQSLGTFRTAAVQQTFLHAETKKRNEQM